MWVDAIPAPPPRMRPSGVNWVVWLIAAGALVVLLAVGAVVADLDKPTGVVSSPSSVRAPSVTVPGSPIPPSPGEAYKIGGFGSPWLEGVYEAPGGVACSWVVQRDLVGDESSVIRRGHGVGGQRVRVALRDGEYFTSDGCGTWQRVGRL